MKKLLLTLVFFSLLFVVSAQTKLNIVNSEDSLIISKNFKDTARINKFLKDRLVSDLSDGFAKAGYDSIIYNKSSVNAHYFRGTKYFTDSVIFPNRKILSKQTKKILNELESNKFSLILLREFLKRYKLELLNSGFAKAEVKLDSILYDNKNVIIKISVDKGEKYYFGGFEISGYTEFPKNYLNLKSGIEKGDFYNEKKLSDLDRVFNNLSFVEADSKWSLYFEDSLFFIKVNLKKKNASSFSGNVGIIPGDEQQNLYLTGMLNLGLLNSFKQAESIILEWKSPDKQSQDLNLKYDQPGIYKNFGLDAGFALEKRDSSYVNANFRLAVSYEKGDSESLLFYERESSEVIEAASENSLIKNYKSNQFGILFNKSFLDYDFNPTEGYYFMISAAGGTKKSDNKSTLKSELNIKGGLYLPLSKNFSFYANNTSGLVFSEQIYDNELMRVAKGNLLRAYDEYAYLSDKFSISAIEILYYPDRFSSIFIFAEGGILNDAVGVDELFYPFCTGAGLYIATNIGRLSLTYGVGRTESSFVDLRQSKIRIGYLSRF